MTLFEVLVPSISLEDMRKVVSEPRFESGTFPNTKQACCVLHSDFQLGRACWISPACLLRILQ